MNAHPSRTSLDTLDGTGSADHNQPYHFGRAPSSQAPYPFSTRQYARLLLLRSRVRSGLACADDLASERSLTAE